MINGIGHVAFRVSNLEAAKRFYCDILGFRHAFDMDREGKPWITYIYINNGQFIELFPDDSGEDLTNRGSYRHFQLEVDDIVQTITELERRGLPSTGVSPRRGRDGNLQYWVTDPDGNRIELMQVEPDSLQRQAIDRLAASARS
ncbi:MAG: VOC family protein [Chloroflexi bacterium]|nr:VOC family protein [Chloroflexota bacterium]